VTIKAVKAAAEAKRAKVRRIGGRQEAGEEGAHTGSGRGGVYL
jgi:hypothetical protein